MTDFERTVDGVRRRDWDKARAFWIDRLALTDDFGSELGVSLSDVPGLSDIAARLASERATADEAYRSALQAYDCQQISSPKGKGAQEELKARRRRFENNLNRTRLQRCQPAEESLPVLSSALFSEGIRLLHKAVHVLGCAESEAHIGTRSWSLCSGYQASLFAAKAILAVCGVGTAEFQSKTVLCDVFPEPQASGAAYTTIKFHFVARRLEHRDMWILIQRVLAVTFCDLWHEPTIDRLKSVEESDFAKQRNDIQYKNRFWPLADMYEFLTVGSFGEIRAWEVSSEDLNFDRDDISLVSAHYFVRLALVLVSNLASVSNKLLHEVELFRRCLVLERHPLYFESLQSELAHGGAEPETGALV